MPIEYSTTPWIDNWPIYRQLWQPGDKTPGTELNLVPTNRNLTVQWRNSDGDIVLAFSELQSQSPIAIVNQSRGVVEVALKSNQWEQLQPTEAYTCEIIAYGALYDSFEFTASLPESGTELISGNEVYASPREILEVIGRIPGAEVEITVSLSGEWTLNAQGYWTKTIAPTQLIYGLWVNDQHARQVSYDQLALGCDRQFARVDNILYYKGSENLADPITYVETAHNRYVLRCLQEATAEIDRKAGTFFNKRRVYRELHKATYRMQQVSCRARPIVVDRFFRIDCYSYSRTLIRRYTEENHFQRGYGNSDRANRILADGETGVLTLTESFWDWVDWGDDSVSLRSLRGLSYFPQGDVGLELTYTGGYAFIPTDLSEACANFAAIRQGIFWQQAITQGMAGMSIGCVNMNFGQMFNQWIPGWQSSGDAIVSQYQKYESLTF